MSNFNYKLAQEIYGVSPWFVDQQSFPVLMAIFNNFGKGISMENPDTKYNTPEIYDIKNDTRVITRPYGDRWNPGQLESKESFEAIGVININGAITVNGGASSMGMEQVSSLMNTMASDSRVKAFIIVGDSGGGASAAVEIMTETINKIKQEMPVYGLVKKGGLAASAMYGIMSACSYIYAESEMSVVGSAGTMLQFEGRKANTEDPDGVKHIRLYASKSIKKNEGFEEAINNDNYEILMNEMLNPVNERFLKLIETNRPQLKGTEFDTGKTVFAKDAIGTFIDGIATFKEVADLISTDLISNKNKKITNSKNQKMNKQNLKNDHPALYNEVFNEGVESGIAKGKEEEIDRCGSWMAHSATDLEAVQQGILSGKAISATARENFLVKASSKQNLEKIKADSAGDLDTEESKNKPTETEVENFYKGVSEKIS